MILHMVDLDLRRAILRGLICMNAHLSIMKAGRILVGQTTRAESGQKI